MDRRRVESNGRARLRPPLRVRWINAKGRLRAALGRPPQPCSEDALLRAARAATGLDDFGDPAFREGLRVLLEAYQREARLTAFGHQMVEGELLGILCARLGVEAGWRHDPAVLEAPVTRPIFILGLPRTGTTALHHLLAADPGNQVLEYWLASAPGPRPPRRVWSDDPRHAQAEAGLEFMYGLDPSLKAIHLMTADGPDECRHLFLQSFTDDTFDSNATVPSYSAWYARRDMRPTYARHRDILRLIQSGSGGDGRWVLKYPAHLAHLHVLLETYPDACIVQTHRDPRRVLPSLCSLVTGWRGLYEDDVPVRELARWQVEMWASRMEHAMQVRAEPNRDPAQFLDLSFREIVADPLGAVAHIYDHFGILLTADAEKRMHTWREAHPRGEHGGHEYSAEAFGLDEREIDERFARYREHYAVEREETS